MKRLLLTCGVLTLVSLVPRPASAAPIDPIIGVRGARGGSPQITDPTFQQLGDCSAFFDDMSGYICAAFNLPESFADGLYAVDLTFMQDGQLIPTTYEGEQILNIDDPHAGFTQFQNVDAFTIRLFGGAAPDGALACGPTVEGPPEPCVGRPEDDGGIEILSAFSLMAFSMEPLSPGDDAVVFLKDPFAGSSYTVSVTNPQNTPVPEPGTLLLMGIGVAGLFGRRFRPRAA
jgi:hypothetical protein